GDIRGKADRSLLFFWLLPSPPYFVPGRSRFRPGVVSGPANPDAGLPDSLGNQAISGPESIQSQSPIETAPLPLGKPGEVEDASGHALDHFFNALAISESKGSAVRICHYGDSPITNDGITSTVRKLLQLRFGDAGHGFILAGKPWDWYGHEGVVQPPGHGGDSDPMFMSRGDHLYGLGGASFTARAAGASASFATADTGDVGRNVAAFDVYYLMQPGGGDLQVEVDGEPRGTITTAS